MALLGVCFRGDLAIYIVFCIFELSVKEALAGTDYRRSTDFTISIANKTDAGIR